MQPAPTAAVIGRREFLKLSAGSAALLSAGALTAGLAGCARSEPPAPGYRTLRPGDLALFTALTPVMLGPAWPAGNRDSHLAALLRGIDGSCALLAPAGQKMLRDLFDLLDGGLTRRLTTGVSRPWAEASEEDIGRFLNRWRDSSLGLFNAGYRGLNKLIVANWYALPAGLAGTGYPGPWAPMYTAVNAA